MFLQHAPTAEGRSGPEVTNELGMSHRAHKGAFTSIERLFAGLSASSGATANLMGNTAGRHIRGWGSWVGASPSGKGWQCRSECEPSAVHGGSHSYPCPACFLHQAAATPLLFLLLLWQPLLLLGPGVRSGGFSKAGHHSHHSLRRV